MLTKSLYGLILTFFASASLFSIDLSPIQTAVKKNLRKYQEAVLSLESIHSGKNGISQSFTKIYSTIELVIKKIVNLPEVKEKIKTLVETNYNNIIENNTDSSFLTNADLNALYPEIAKKGKIFQQIFFLMVKKEYYQQIWQKLTEKENKLQSSSTLKQEFELDLYD